MYNLINSTEEALIDQFNDNESYSSHYTKNNKHNSDKKQKPKRYCSYHKTNTHDDENCRAIKDRTNNKDKFHKKFDNDKGCNSLIKEPKRDNQTLEIETIINNRSYNFLLTRDQLIHTSTKK
ncbi:hypothetical protein DMUE_1623 [Dictyocoela muelleri]|nr:hypothetical protein DMUE_1623 [Dictyocoela muelleri]